MTKWSRRTFTCLKSDGSSSGFELELIDAPPDVHVPVAFRRRAVHAQMGNADVGNKRISPNLGPTLASLGPLIPLTLLVSALHIVHFAGRILRGRIDLVECEGDTLKIWIVQQVVVLHALALALHAVVVRSGEWRSVHFPLLLR